MQSKILPHLPLADFTASLPPFGRLLGLDVGSHTIGMAISDYGRQIASPLSTIKRSKWAADKEILLKTIAQHTICGIIVGLPRNMNGSESARCQSTHAFVKNLASHVTIPISLWDERMSTMAAERAMLQADMSRQKRAAKMDQMAATYILQGALDAMSNGFK